MKAWEEFIQKLEPKLGSNTVNQWVRSLKIDRFDARNLYLQTKDPLQISWFEEHIRPYIKNGLFNNNERPIQVHITLDSQSAQKNLTTAIKAENKPSFSIQPNHLDPELTFDTFITDKENLVAYKLFKEPTNLEFNPVFLYGSHRSGKTHLLTAAANLLQSQGKKIFFVKAETFTTHVVQAIRLGLMQQFRSIYRNIDALFVDDIDFLAKKDASQEEFFHTFNALHTLGKKIFLSSTLAPSKLQDIEPRLISRFEWGLSLKIDPVDSLKILQAKAKIWKLSYSPDVLQFLALKFPQDPILGLQALSLRTQGMFSITPEKTAVLLQDLLQQTSAREINFEFILEKVAEHFEIKVEDILGKSQSREIAYPRQIAMFLTRDKLKIPFQKIGEHFSRDHSTVMASVKQMQKLFDEKQHPTFSDISKINQSIL